MFIEKKTLKLIFIGISCLILSFSLIEKTEAQCSDWGDPCGDLVGVNCCSGYTCIYDMPKIGTCCNPSLAGGRGEPCKCEEDCRFALTCTGGICCDGRSDWKRDIGVTCYCDVECKSGQCIGGVCAGADTCSQAGCACIDTIINCERIIGGEHDPGLTCSDPSYNVCCCSQELPPPNGDGFCNSPCNPPCTCNRGPLCSGVPIDCCAGSPEYLCCCPINGNGNGNGDGNGNGNGDNSWPIGGNGGIIDLQSPLGCTTIEGCISRMINFLFSLAVILTPLMIILAGFLYITAAGKPEKIVQAQKLITWTLIGFLIVSLARAIIYVITSVIGG